MRKHFIFIFLISIIPTYIFGGTLYQLNFIGFSTSGDYLAYELYGSQDGSGTPFSEIYIVDTKRNKYAVEPIVIVYDIIPNSQEEFLYWDNKTRSDCWNGAKPYLNKYGIKEGNLGNTVYDEYSDDNYSWLEKNELKKNPILDVKEISFVYNNTNYTLQLTEIDCTCNPWLDEIKQSKMFKLLLKTNYYEKILQWDKKLPKSRLCPEEYGIFRVFIYKDIISVFLDFSQKISFEHPNIEKLVVTGIFY